MKIKLPEPSRFFYTDGTPAAVGDHVEFRVRYGHRTMQTVGVIKDLDHMYGQVHIDISPQSYRRDMGRFGTEETSIFTIHSQTRSVGPTAAKRVIAAPYDDWSLGVLCHFDEWIKKIEPTK